MMCIYRATVQALGRYMVEGVCRGELGAMNSNYGIDTR
jgi:hypothetical protein